MAIVETVNVATHLARQAAEQPERLAIVVPTAKLQRTFRQLHDESDHLAHGLQGIGIQRGMRIVLMVPPSLDFFTLTFALFKIGAVPVLIDPGMGIRNLGRCLAEAEPEAFIGVPKAHLARKLLRWARSTIRITVTTGRFLAGFALADVLRNGSTAGLYALADTKGDETAAILFTSGSTGPAKGVVYTHGIFAAQVDLLRASYGIEAGEIDLSTFPLFALFGPALGMTAIVPDMDPTRPAMVDPRKIIRAIETYGVTNLFGSPALIDRVGRFVEETGVKLPTLKRVISAGAPVPAKVIERFTKALSEGAQVHTPYGATEALPVSSIGSDELLLAETRYATQLGCGVCVGRPIESVQICIIPISDEPMSLWNDSNCLRSREIGEIAVSGPIVTQTYFNRPQATELAKMRDPATGVIWHRMGDVGYLDAEGRLWFCGRKSQRVVTSRGTLFTIPCEALFSKWGSRQALVGVRVDGDVKPVLCIEFEAGRPKKAKGTSWEATEMQLRDRARQNAHTWTIATFLQHPGFPVDIRHNAKIFREKLAIWAEKKLNGYRWPEIDEPLPVHLPPTFDPLMRVMAEKQQ